jgi:hypothetical protein
MGWFEFLMMRQGGYNGQIARGGVCIWRSLVISIFQILAAIRFIKPAMYVGNSRAITNNIS